MRFTSILTVPVFFVAFASMMSAQSGNIFPQNGNVGIGTASPGYPLSVVGTTYGWNSAVAYFTNSSTTSNNAFIAATPGMTPGNETYFSFGVDTDVNNWASYGFYFAGPNSPSNRIDIGFPSHNQLLTVLAGGNVGVGTATPTAKLEVNGDVKMSGSGAMLTFPDGSHQTTAYTGSTSGGGTSSPSLPDITDINGKVGIGTSSPDATLRVAGRAVIGTGGQWNTLGTLQITGSNPALAFHYPGNAIDYIQVSREDSTHNTFKFRSDSSGDGAAGIDVQGPGYFGNVGVNSSDPRGLLDVGGVGGLIVSGTNLDPNRNEPRIPLVLGALRNSGRMLLGWNRSGGGGDIDLVAGGGGSGLGGFRFYDYTNAGALNLLMAMPGNGNVGIGTDSPGTKLEVNGSVKLTTNSGASITFQDNSVQTVAWNGVLSGGDYAESVDVTGDRREYEPGDVLVIDPSFEGKFLKSSEPYSTAVMGIYSTKPGVVGRRQTTDKSRMKHEVPMAMTGIVPTKVSAENGPIKPGDLLVTSSKPGYAMKGTDRSLLIGAVVGKALGHLDAGTGLIEAAVALQ